MEKEISTLQIENKIFIIRGVQVMIDRDIAELYGVETRVLNQAVKRNSERFPEEFMFQLTDKEFENLISQFVISSWRGIRKLPYVFTEHGVTMLASVLKSETAVKASIQIVKAFVSMRHFAANNAELFVELKAIRQHQIETDVHLKESDSRIDKLFDLMDKYKVKDEQGIYFQGQIFDAYAKFETFMAQAKKRNYPHRQLCRSVCFTAPCQKKERRQCNNLHRPKNKTNSSGYPGFQCSIPDTYRKAYNKSPRQIFDY